MEQEIEAHNWSSGSLAEESRNTEISWAEEDRTHVFCHTWGPGTQESDLDMEAEKFSASEAADLPSTSEEEALIALDLVSPL